MSFEVSFKATVTPALIEQVFIQDDEVPASSGKTAVIEDYSAHGTMNVTFRISGPNGSAFKIAYSCTSDGTDTADKKQPSPVSGSIAENGVFQLTLKIPV